MADEKIVVMESGTENRTLSWGVTPEGKATEREPTVTFEPTDGYPHTST